MKAFGNALAVIGLLCLIVGVLGLLSLFLQSVGVSFDFRVARWYGPLLAGAVLLAAGWFLRRRSSSSKQADA